jgi:hypothetical protein
MVLGWQALSSSGAKPFATRLWGGITPALGFWKWDAHGAAHREAAQGMRWPHLFDDSVSASSAASSGLLPEQIPKTLDPSEFPISLPEDGPQDSVRDSSREAEGCCSHLSSDFV